jgi:hypothetical protein
MNANKGRKGGLDFDPSNVGAQADAYNVASTAMLLDRQFHQGKAEAGIFAPARHAVALHVISGKLHRMAERLCNEDLTCPACSGDGMLPRGNGINPAPGRFERRTCPVCAGRGNTLGRREASLIADASEIAEHYGFKAYHQTDPRGCSLYLCDAPDADAGNYNHGHAVCRLGR